ncbi:hypothetical protein FHY18_003758 [Xanthomonas arboricola]|uniref:hypothetical protein n=1 Tax=Xanthomonas sp. 3793 TaxID=3035312 RepID=UPI0021672022|nr:hypothetical protein [Xanthomonas sp. 3793]MCS3748125.1 hypothetical protein [Xanthomonas sp. 3793]
MGAYPLNTYAVFTAMLCVTITGCTSPSQAIASQREPTQLKDQPATVGCPAKDFATFLERYADSTDDSVRRRFTDDPLEYEVPTYTVEDMTDSSPLTHISKIKGPSRFELFSYRYFRNAKVFDHIDPGEANPEPEGDAGFPFTIEAGIGGDHTVSFGMEYEIDSYLFKRSKGCWRLTRAINLRD